jgi:hypothetical protein
VTQIVDRGTKQPRHFDVVLLRVVQLHEGGAYVTASKRLTDRGWQEDRYELVSPPAPVAKAEEKIDREEVTVLGEKIACEKRTREEKTDSFTNTSSQWLPLGEKWKEVLAGAGVKHVKESQTQAIKDSFAEHKMKSESVITSFRAESFVGGKAVSCVQFKTRHWEGEMPWYSEYTYHSRAVPRWRVATISAGMRDYSISHVLDFGEAEKAVPEVEQLRGYYGQAVQLLKAVDLKKPD